MVFGVTLILVMFVFFHVFIPAFLTVLLLCFNVVRMIDQVDGRDFFRNVTVLPSTLVIENSLTCVQVGYFLVIFYESFHELSIVFGLPLGGFLSTFDHLFIRI